MKKLIATVSGLICLVCLALSQPARYREVFYDANTHISMNYVRFMNTNNTYYGYDFLVNPENIVTNATIDWSFGKMAEMIYTSPVSPVFTNEKNWVSYTLKATGTNIITWPTNNWTFLNTYTANSNHVYVINRFNDNINYVYQYAIGGTNGSAPSTNDITQWSYYPALTNVVVGTNRIYMADGAYLYSESTNLWFVHP